MKLSANQQAIADAIATIQHQFGHATVQKIADLTALSKAAVSANMKPMRDKNVITTAECDGVMTICLAAVQAAPAVIDHPVPVSKTVAKLKAVTSFAPEVKCNELKRQGTRPRDIVLQLIAGGNITKKMAKGLVYDNRSL